MAKIVDVNIDAEDFVRSVKLLVGSTLNDGVQIPERSIYKIVLSKGSGI